MKSSPTKTFRFWRIKLTKTLHIQLQPERCEDDVEAHVRDIIAIAMDFVSDASVVVQRGDDDGPYININIDTADVALLWSSMSFAITSDPSLASATIVCCEGDNGWDDYLLLHHFDKTENIDTLD